MCCSNGLFLHYRLLNSGRFSVRSRDQQLLILNSWRLLLRVSQPWSQKIWVWQNLKTPSGMIKVISWVPKSTNHKFPSDFRRFEICNLTPSQKKPFSMKKKEETWPHRPLAYTHNRPFITTGNVKFYHTSRQICCPKSFNKIFFFQISVSFQRKLCLSVWIVELRLVNDTVVWISHATLMSQNTIRNGTKIRQKYGSIMWAKGT